jgi:hypothetical protein
MFVWVYFTGDWPARARGLLRRLFAPLLGDAASGRERGLLRLPELFPEVACAPLPLADGSPDRERKAEPPSDPVCLASGLAGRDCEAVGVSPKLPSG